VLNKAQLAQDHNVLTFYRPPDILVGGLRFYRDFSFFFCHLPSELAERNSTKTGHMLRSECDLKALCPKFGVSPPLQIGGPKTTFWLFRNLTATLTAYILVPSALQTTRGLLHRLKMSWTLVYKRLKIGSEFLPILHKFCFLLYCWASRTANRTQPNFVKRCTV